MKLLTSAALVLSCALTASARPAVDLEKRDSLSFQPVDSQADEAGAGVQAEAPKHKTNELTFGLYAALGYLIGRDSNRNAGYGQYGVTQGPYYGYGGNSGNTIVHVNDANGYGYGGYPGYGYDGYGSDYYGGVNQYSVESYPQDKALYRLPNATEANLPQVTKETRVVLQATKVRGPASATSQVPVTLTLHPSAAAQSIWANKIQKDLQAQGAGNGTHVKTVYVTAGAQPTK